MKNNLMTTNEINLAIELLEDRGFHYNDLNGKFEFAMGSICNYTTCTLIPEIVWSCDYINGEFYDNVPIKCFYVDYVESCEGGEPIFDHTTKLSCYVKNDNILYWLTEHGIRSKRTRRKKSEKKDENKSKTQIDYTVPSL